MINLIIILYAFLFPIQEPVKTVCQDKLQELNYVYDIPLLHEDSLSSKAKHIQEIKNTINCFKKAVQLDTGKVLLVTLHSLHADRRYSNRASWFGVKEILALYNLPPNTSFFTTERDFMLYDQKELSKKSFRIELVTNSNKRLYMTRNGNNKYHYSFTPPF